MKNETKLNEPKLIKSELQPGYPGEQEKPTSDDYERRRPVVTLVRMSKFDFHSTLLLSFAIVALYIIFHAI